MAGYCRAICSWPGIACPPGGLNPCACRTTEAPRGPKTSSASYLLCPRLRQRHSPQRPPAVPALLEVQHRVQLADPATQGPGVEVLAVDVLRLHEARVPGVAVDGQDVQVPLLGIDPERV